MNPLITEDLVQLRHAELRRQAGAERRRRADFSAWEHPWRRGLGEQLERWGRRLQAGAAPASGRTSTYAG